MDPRYAAGYAELAEGHWWWQARESLLIAEIQRLRRGKGRGRILDIGCGEGRLFPLLEEFGEVEGIEPDPTTLAGVPTTTRRIHHVSFQPPLPITGEFDLILMLDVLEHLDDPVERLGLVRSLLAPDGVLLLTVPALPILWTRHDQLNHHRLRYTRRELCRQLVAAELSVRQLRYEFHALAVAKLLVRLRECFGRDEPAVPRVPGRSINRILFAFSRVEGAVCRPVAQWLPGSSLLATVGRQRPKS